MNGEMHGRKRGSDVFETWAWLLPRLRQDGPVRKGVDSPCWEWPGPRERKGYGRIDVQKAPVLTHRLAWWATHGAAPAPDVKVLHRCDNPPCCNPDHLFLGSYADNNADRAAKGRNASGRKIRALHPLNRLTEDVVRHIRTSVESADDLAIRLGVNRSTVMKARTGKTWRYVHE